MQLEGIFPVTGSPGIKRDGTSFESNFYADGQWVRFQRGKPRKIGGCNLLVGGLAGPVRGSFIDRKDGYFFLYFGSSHALQQVQMSASGGAGGVIDRTPSGFVANPNNLWQFDILYDAGGNAKRLLAHSGQNLQAIDSSVQTPIYYGTSNGTTALTSTGTSVSGGVFSMAPYMFGLDNDGYALWSPPNTMSFSGSGSGSARIAPNKLIKGIRTRGGSGYSPAGLIFSLDELYRVYFTGGAAIWNFDYIGSTSLLSPASVVEYNGQYYWPDQNKWCMFNGTIQDMKNDFNINYFFDNLNRTQTQKIYGFRNSRYNEIWWMYPKGNSTECNAAIIYNLKDNIWYDTDWILGQTGRSSAIAANMFPYPIMTGLEPDAAGNYSLWQHEFGVDIISGSKVAAIPAQFTTTDISYCAEIAPNTPIGVDRWVELMRIEPDFVQTGDMQVVISGNNYANQPLPPSAPYTFSPQTAKIDMKEQRRQLRLTFSSNVAGGDFQLGKTLLSLSMGDGRQ